MAAFSQNQMVPWITPLSPATVSGACFMPGIAPGPGDVTRSSTDSATASSCLQSGGAETLAGHGHRPRPLGKGHMAGKILHLRV